MKMWRTLIGTVAALFLIPLAGCSMTTAGDTSDAVIPPSGLSSVQSPTPPTSSEGIAQALNLLVAVCPDPTPAQQSLLTQGLAALFSIDQNAQVSQDPALQNQNVEQFVDNVSQACGAPLSSAERRTLVAGLSSLIG